MYASSLKTTFKIIIYIFLIIFASLLYAEQNDKCPETVSTWREKELTLSCGREKYYHCLKDEKKRTVQKCLGKSWVQPGFCPEYNSVANEIDVFLCKESLGECPVTTFWSNELYKYSACLNAVTSEKDKHRKIDGNRTESNGGLSINIIVIIASCSLILVLAVSFTLFCVFRKKKNFQKKKDGENATQEIGIELSPFERKTSYSSASDEKHGYQKDTKDVTKPLINQDVTVHSYQDVKTKGHDEVREVPEKQIPSGNKQIDKTERIRSLIKDHLSGQGGRLLIIVESANDKGSIEQVLRDIEPGYIKISSFEEWSKAEKEGHIVFLPYILDMRARGHSLIGESRNLTKIASDADKLRLQLVIPIRKDAFNDDKEFLFRHKLFQGIHYSYIEENL